MMNSRNILLVTVSLLLLVGLFARFYLLSHVPLGYYFDELDYVFTGEAIARYGTDISGAWSPFSLRPLQLLNTISELASVFHAIVQKVFGFGPSTGHLPSALFGLLSAALLSAISYVVTKKKSIALVTLATVMVSPWHVYISRVSYEGVISLAFQLSMLLGFVTVFKQKTHEPKKLLIPLLLTLIGAFFGYYTYHGAKFTVVTVGIVLAVYLAVKKHSKNVNLYFVIPTIITLCALLFHTAYLQSLGAFGNRSSETLFNQSMLTDQVDQYRKKSLDYPGKKYLLSKPTLLFENVVKRYFDVFDITQLGIKGEESIFQFSLFVHGFIYLSTLPLLLLGFHYFWRRYREEAKLLALTLAVSPITNVISNSNTQSIFRSALTYALCVFFVSLGTVAVYKKYRKVFFILALILVAESVFFVSMFFGRFPIVTADNHYFHEKLVASYAKRTEKDVVIVTDSGEESYKLARSLLYYNQLMPLLSTAEREQFSSTNGTYEFLSFSISSDCPTEFYEENVYLITTGKKISCVPVIVSPNALDLPEVTMQKDPLVGLGSPIDSRIYYLIYNDDVCDLSKLNSYVYNSNRYLFNTLHLDSPTFCQSWMLKEE